MPIIGIFLVLPVHLKYLRTLVILLFGFAGIFKLGVTASEDLSEPITRSEPLRVYHFGDRSYGIGGELIVHKRLGLHEANGSLYGFLIQPNIDISPVSWTAIVLADGRIVANGANPSHGKIEISKHRFPSQLFRFRDGEPPQIYIDRFTLILNNKKYIDSKWSPYVLNLQSEFPYQINTIEVSIKLNTGRIQSGKFKIKKLSNKISDFDLTRLPHSIKNEKIVNYNKSKSYLNIVAITPVRSEITAYCDSYGSNERIENIKISLNKHPLLNSTNDTELVSTKYIQPVYRAWVKHKIYFDFRMLDLDNDLTLSSICKTTTGRLIKRKIDVKQEILKKF